VPSCQQAFTHFYEAGCVYTDLSTGSEIPVGDMIEACRQVLAEAPSICDGEVDDWIVCIDSVQSPSTTNADCDCSSEQEALFICE
jgi:hypothetical protein